MSIIKMRSCLSKMESRSDTRVYADTRSENILAQAAGNEAEAQAASNSH